MIDNKNISQEELNRQLEYIKKVNEINEKFYTEKGRRKTMFISTFGCPTMWVNRKLQNLVNKHIGSKWKLLIIRNLLERPWCFNELQKSLEAISQKVLTDSLRSMEADGIITRTVFPEVPPRVEYALSDLGETMRPILDSMKVWGENYKNRQGPIPKNVLKQC